MRDDETKWSRLARYLAGECPAEERRRLEAWIQADSEHQRLMRRLRRIWTAAAHPPPKQNGEGVLSDEEVAADFEAVMQKVRAREQQTRGGEEQMRVEKAQRSASDRTPAMSRPAAGPECSRKRQGAAASRMRPLTSLGQAARVAVVLVLLVGGALLALKLSGGSFQRAAPVRTITTGPGERATLRLADGTKVMLNVDSRLRIAEGFSKGPRRAVYLQGEAFFEVAPSAERPFIAYAGGAAVRAVGTAFTVEAYAGEARSAEGSAIKRRAAAVEVAVSEGTVVLGPEDRSGNGPALTLERGQVGRLTAGGRRATKQATSDIEAYTAWTEGRLVFRSAPLTEVATRLERWYGVECEIQGEVPRPLRLTATLSSRSISNVLNVITASLGLEYRIEDNTLILMRKE